MIILKRFLFNPKLILFLIILVFLITRIYKIDEIPSTLYWDEASIGYNAYSISQDLKDEWGDFLPLHFRAFGEFKLPVYIYSTAIFTKVLGLNAFSIRLPAVLFSVGSLVLIYLISKKIYKSEATGLISSAFFATAPW